MSSPKRTARAEISRRGALAGGLGLLAGCSTAPAAPPPGPPATAPPAEPAPLTQPVTVQRMHSAARDKDVELALVVPSGVPAAGLPVCLALHGRGASARTFLGLGLPDVLSSVVRAGTPPFAVAAVDGDHYWVDVGSGDDPQRMLADEVPGWLAQRNLRPASAVLGISMGGYGALHFSRAHRDLRAVATASAALFTSWPDAKSRKIFGDEAQWRATEPLLHTDELRGAGTGVWCGESDPFVTANRRLIKALSPEVAAISPGNHNDDYWRRVLPDILKFVGKRLAG
ncbi:MAG TPA: alpha/beta hydrolase-fold protein [Amycolatopsis sp.]|nr:alpha/beta hydrolase-fold protein [Amycolatopsis sp.]